MAICFCASLKALNEKCCKTIKDQETKYNQLTKQI